jgi:ABC-2 type transport system permease protein
MTGSKPPAASSTLSSTLSLDGVPTLIVLHLRTRWKLLTVTVAALVLTMAGTAVAAADLYPTPADLQGYADAVETGALYAINGRVEGIDTLGGVIQDEFGFLSSFLLPLLGAGLVTTTSRSEEEAGRLHHLRAGTIGRRAPIVASLVVTVGTMVVITAGFVAGLVAAGVPLSRSVLYATSLAALAFVFAGLAAAAGQVGRVRVVVAFSATVLVAAYVLRGVGDVTGTWVTWLSPLGWQEKAAPFGPTRWWTLSLPLATGAMLMAFAIWHSGRRDIGSVRFGSGPGPARAAGWLRSPLGLALWTHRPALIGWLAATMLLAGSMGALAREVSDALASNPDMAEAIGAGTGQPLDAFLAATQRYLAMLATGFAVQSVVRMWREEREGRMEPVLAGSVSRNHLFLANSVVVLAGLALVVLAGSLVLGVATALSLDDPGEVAPLLGAGLAHLPAELILTAAAMAAVGAWPRATAAAWGWYGLATAITLLGPGLGLADWLLDLAPATHIGDPPQGSVEMLPLAVLTSMAVALAGVGLAGFRRRDVPGR